MKITLKKTSPMQIVKDVALLGAGAYTGILVDGAVKNKNNSKSILNNRTVKGAVLAAVGVMTSAYVKNENIQHFAFGVAATGLAQMITNEMNKSQASSQRTPGQTASQGKRLKKSGSKRVAVSSINGIGEVELTERNGSYYADTPEEAYDYMLLLGFSPERAKQVIESQGYSINGIENYSVSGSIDDYSISGDAETDEYSDEYSDEGVGIFM